MKRVLTVLGWVALAGPVVVAIAVVNEGGRVPLDLLAMGLGGGLSALWAAAVLERLDTIAARLPEPARPGAAVAYGQAGPGIAAGPALTPEQTSAAVETMRAALPER